MNLFWQCASYEVVQEHVRNLAHDRVSLQCLSLLFKRFNQNHLIVSQTIFNLQVFSSPIFPGAVYIFFNT